MQVGTKESGAQRPAMVSVVIPCYRQSRFLQDAIESAQNQTYRNVEIIVINDGSDDETEQIARRYGEKVIYRYQDNSGLAAARNAGYSLSSGEYIQFLDADDVLLPGKVEMQVRVLQANKRMEVCLSDYALRRVGEAGELQKPRVQPGADVLRDVACCWETLYSVPIHVALFRREAWGGGRPFNEKLRAREDWVMWVELALKGNEFGYVNEVLAEYRIHSGGMCRDWKIMCFSLIEAAEILRPKLPLSHQAEFDDHVVGLLALWLRTKLLVKAKDYSGLYQQCRADYRACRESLEVGLFRRQKSRILSAMKDVFRAGRRMI